MISQDRLQQRAQLLRALRDFFHDRHYLEVETPIRIPLPLPESHIDPFTSEDWFLHASPELCMKRLLAQGMEAVFQICKVFRKGERGARHLPEFTMLEWYRAGWNYENLMAQCEELFQFIDERLALGGEITHGKRKISLRRPWQRITVANAFARYGAIGLAEAMATDMYEEILVRDIEPHLGTTCPTILYDYPVEHGSLAKTKAHDPTVAERFELYLGGIELANGFTELNDPDEQRRRFLAEAARMQATGKKALPLPERFLQDLAKMPQAAGIALGVDRLAMVFFNRDRIADVVSFTSEDLA